MITSNGKIKNTTKGLLEFEARSKEDIKRKYRLGLNMIIQIAKNLHDQDFTNLKLSVTGKAQVRKFPRKVHVTQKNYLVSM